MTNKLRHGAIVVCADQDSEWYGRIGRVTNMRTDRAGVKFDCETSPPATGRWIRKEDLVPVEEVEGELGQAMRVHDMVDALILKTQESAEAAVAAFNRPGVAFRMPGYIVLMIIAWTSALLAKFLRDGKEPYYRKNGKIEEIHGKPKMWSPLDCVKKTYPNVSDPVRANLEMFITIRDQIEHAVAPQLDEDLFGEAQAAVLNLDQFLRSNFGEVAGLASSLPLAIQLGGRPDPQQSRAWKAWYGPEVDRLMKTISDYRSKLPEETWSDPRYRYRVLLVPTTANRERSADVAVRFVHYDPSDKELAERLKQVDAIIRPKTVEVPLANALRPVAVCKEVQKRIGFKFRPTPEHSAAWRHFKVRPPNPGRPDDCRKEYCFWFEATREYLYTSAWVDLLVDKLGDPENWADIIGRSPQQLDAEKTAA